MNFYGIMASIITLAVMVAYVNHRFVRMQHTIGIMSGALLISMAVLTLGKLGYAPSVTHDIAAIVSKIDFNKLLLDGMLSFLLFAGALNVDINDLRDVKWEIATLATVGTVTSTLIIGSSTYYLLAALGIHIQWVHALLFGALISPTDPIAVLAIFQQMGAPRKLNITVAGESLFNDGVGIVLFLTVFELAFGKGQDISFMSVSTLFLQQAMGGIAYGVVLGLLGYWLIKPIEDSKLEILITIAIVTGGYGFAEVLSVSGPLAMVVAGIFIGNHGRRFSMSKAARENVDTFWELIDELLNAILFFLIGLELLVLPLTQQKMEAALLAIPLVLAARWLTVAAPLSVFKRFKTYPACTIRILTWGGLRGGLAVALALALPDSPSRDLIVVMTYAVVIFAILVQGSTIKPMIKRSHVSNLQQ